MSSNIKSKAFSYGDVVILDSKRKTCCEVMVLSQTKNRLYTTVCNPFNHKDSWDVMTNRLEAKP